MRGDDADTRILRLQVRQQPMALPPFGLCTYSMHCVCMRLHACVRTGVDVL